MAVTINKAKAKTKASVVSDEQVAHIATLVDDLGAVKKKMDAAAKKAAPLSKQYGKIEAELIKYVDEQQTPPDVGKVLEGENYEVEIGAMGNKTEITENSDVAEMLDGIEDGLAFALMKFGITDLRKYLTPKQFESVSITERVTKRRLKLSNK